MNVKLASFDSTAAAPRNHVAVASSGRVRKYERIWPNILAQLKASSLNINKLELCKND